MPLCQNGPNCLAGLIWALDALPSLVSVYIDFKTTSTSVAPLDGTLVPEDISLVLLWLKLLVFNFLLYLEK